MKLPDGKNSIINKRNLLTKKRKNREIQKSIPLLNFQETRL